MNKYLYECAALVLVLGAVPSIAAANNANAEGTMGVQVRAEMQGSPPSADPSLQDSGASEQLKQKMQQQQEQFKEMNSAELERRAKGQASTSPPKRSAVPMNAPIPMRGTVLMERIHVKLENATTSVRSLEQLQQSIAERKRELDREEASTTRKYQDIVKEANPARLAVHTLLASKDLLGNIGGQVSQIAKDIDGSIATTTNIEAKIQSRSFLSRLFLGGDGQAAEAISQQITVNQQHIDELNKLLGGAEISADVRATLSAQITTVENAQKRLQDVAQKEDNQWGLFSWRLFKK